MGIKKQLDDHLRDWRSTLLKSAVLHSRHVYFPDRFKSKQSSATTTKIYLEEPICFSSLPLGSSESHKQRRVWAFIKGSFETEGREVGQRLTKFGASVTFFEAKPRARRFKLLDAFHFDYHPQKSANSAPHPIFHVQRNVDWEEEQWRRSLQRGAFNEFQDYKFPAVHPGVLSANFRLTRFRIPSPRLDIFGVILVTTADMVIQHDVAEHREAFDTLLKSMEDLNNPLHALTCELENRPLCFPHTESSSGRWYPKFDSFPTSEN